MSVLICPHDKTENLPQALVCVQCERRLSRVQLGDVFVQRYRIVSCLEETETGFRYLADLFSQPCILEEIIPEAAKTRQSLKSFSTAVRRLTEARPRCRAPVLEYFSHRSCFYIVEKPAEGKGLQQMIGERGAWPEEQAHSLLAGLLSGLKELYATAPPLYLGDVSTATIIIGEDQKPLFLGRRYILDSIERPAAPAASEVLSRDLQGCALAVGAALAGSPAAEAERVRKAITRMKDFLLACTLEWLLYQHRKEPASLQELEQFRGLIAGGELARANGDIRRAIELFDHAFHLSRLSRIEAALCELEKTSHPLRAKEAEKPAQSQPARAKESEKPTPPPPPPPRAKEAAVEPLVVRLPVQESGPGPAASGAKPAQAMASSRAGRQTSKAVQPAQPPTASMKVTSKRPAGRSFWVIAPLIILFIAGWIWISGSRMREFDSAITQGHLVSPVGKSAYDIYKEELASEGPSNASVLEMNSKAASRLHQMSDQQFNRWYQTSDVSTAEWVDLAKAEDWLDNIDSRDATSQARKAYADAEVNFKQKRYPDALNGFERALQRAPNWDLALLGIGKACFELERYDCTEQYYLRAEQLEPAWIWPHRNLMELYISPERRDIPAACAEYHQLTSLSAAMNPPPFRREAVQKKMALLCPAR